MEWVVLCPVPLAVRLLPLSPLSAVDVVMPVVVVANSVVVLMVVVLVLPVEVAFVALSTGRHATAGPPSQLGASRGPQPAWELQAAQPGGTAGQGDVRPWSKSTVAVPAE
mmetsp:Transcript_116647/g.341433  ORF Transcript_116647/g.341433 Transcript_116647/m.341433 type:complete len:110 (+) Transcript_116647:1852-2181(+)